MVHSRQVQMNRSVLRIHRANGPAIDDVNLWSPDQAAHRILSSSTLNFLAVVRIDELPLRLRFGPVLQVTTSLTVTESWFGEILTFACPDVSQSKHQRSWWTNASSTSPLGVLVGFDPPVVLEDCEYRATEILFYAKQSLHQPQSPPSPPKSSPEDLLSSQDSRKLNTTGTSVHLQAVLLSSDLLVAPESEHTPPPSPRPGDSVILGHFLSGSVQPLDWTSESARLAAPVDPRTKTRKRRRVTHETKDDASDGSPLNDDSFAEPDESQRGNVFAQSCSRDPGTPSDDARNEASESRLDIESSNKEVISRLVMAGMRLYGLSQAKGRASIVGSRRGSVTMSEGQETSASGHRRSEQRKSGDSFDVSGKEVRDYQEYKLVYHQAFKGACFAFREHISKNDLRPYADVLRDVVDRLLATFCSDPLILDSQRSGTAQSTDQDTSPFGVRIPGSAAQIHARPRSYATKRG